MSARGSVTVWLLGLALMLVPLGGLALDLGRASSERRALAAAADAAALAGGGALDEARYRRDGTVALDPRLAEQRAHVSLAAQLDRAALRSVVVRADPEQVTVVVEGAVDLTLLRLVDGGAPFTVRVSSTARPHRLP
ncbi:MAG: pilus assembly protein TadG-related protein [Actinomycetota bacterium]